MSDGSANLHCHDELLIDWLLKKPNAKLYNAAQAFARRGMNKIARYESGLYAFLRLPLDTPSPWCSYQIIYLGVTQNLFQRWNDHKAQWFADTILADNDNEWFYLEMKCPMELAYRIERQVADRRRNRGYFPEIHTLEGLKNLARTKQCEAPAQ
jgi:hypothetical protein